MVGPMVMDLPRFPTPWYLLISPLAVTSPTGIPSLVQFRSVRTHTVRRSHSGVLSTSR
jgi:hypothetical protein